MKFVKLLTVPAVLLFTVLVAVPAFANGLSNATITVGCGSGANTGQIGVTLKGDNEVDQNLERILTFGVFATGSSQSLGTVAFDIPAPASKDAPFDQTKFFPAIATGSSFAVKLVGVTDNKGNVSDFEFRAVGAGSTPFIDIDNGVDVATGKPLSVQPVQVGTTSACQTQAASSPRTVTPVASPVATLAQTGGFDYRFPIAGLVLLVAGLVLFVVTSRRRRATDTD